jgi:hypothetical protein
VAARSGHGCGDISARDDSCVGENIHVTGGGGGVLCDRFGGEAETVSTQFRGGAAEHSATPPVPPDDYRRSRRPDWTLHRFFDMKILSFAQFEKMLLSLGTGFISLLLLCWVLVLALLWKSGVGKTLVRKMRSCLPGGSIRKPVRAYGSVRRGRGRPRATIMSV